jgi:hypothetical protein
MYCCIIGDYKVGFLLKTQVGFISHYYNWLFPGLMSDASQITVLIIWKKCSLIRHSALLVSWLWSVMQSLSQHTHAEHFTIHNCRFHLTINWRLFTKLHSFAVYTCQRSAGTHFQNERLWLRCFSSGVDRLCCLSLFAAQLSGFQKADAQQPSLWWGGGHTVSVHKPVTLSFLKVVCPKLPPSNAPVSPAVPPPSSPSDVTGSGVPHRWSGLPRMAGA